MSSTSLHDSAERNEEFAYGFEYVSDQSDMIFRDLEAIQSISTLFRSYGAI